MPHNEQLLQLLKDQEYNECLQLLKETPCEDFAALVLESKVYEKGSLRKSFWDSALVNYTISLLLKSEDCMALLHPYFSFSTPTNPKLLLKIWKQDSELFITLFKRFQRFLHNTWIEAIENMSTSIIPSKQLAVENLIQEFIKIQTLENSITVERKADFQSLQKIPIDKVLIGFCFAHGAMMENQEINGNNTRKKELDMAIVTTLDLFLKHLKDHPLTHSFSFKDNQTLQKEWEYFRPKHKSETKKAITYKNDLIYSKIQKIIAQDITRQSKRYYISAYTAEMCLPYGPNFLYAKYNDKHSSFKKDDSKSGYEELYFSMNARAKMIGIKEGQFDLLSIPKAMHSGQLQKLSFIEEVTMTQISSLEFYQIPSDVPNTNIDLKLALLILTEFSRYKSPLSRFFYPQKNKDVTLKRFHKEVQQDKNNSALLLNVPPESFSKLLGSNEAISVFDYKTLLKALRTYYNQPITIIKDNLDFLICDLNDSNKLSGWLQRPFIKIDDKVFWLGRLLKDRRWDILLRGKLKEDKTYAEKSIYNALVQKIDKSLETATGKIFQDKKFSIEIGWEFPNPSNPKKQGGDIDVVAYKDKHLFVVQIKNGGHSNDIRQASYIEDKQLMNQAAKQLDGSLHFIHNNWSKVQDKFNFSHSKSDVTIFPLIVTNVYNGDYKTFKSYDKISLFELYIIMNNAKKGLYHSSSHLFTSDKNSPSFNPEALKMLLGSNFDLWNKETVLKPSTLIKCIQSDSVWKDLERIRNFKV